MFQKHRVEVITFVVALSTSVSILGWMEYQKPHHGLLAYLQREAEVRNRHTGAVLVSGPTQQEAILTYLERVRRRRAEEQSWVEGAGPTPGFQGVGGRPRSRIGRKPGGRLAGADLRKIDFSGADLSGLSLRSAYCEDASFVGTHLNDARLEETIFTGANFRESLLNNANVSNADLSHAVLVDVQAHGGNFQGANFTGSDLSGGDFSGADLTGANFSDVVFSPQTNFTGANLTKAQHVSEALRLHAEKSGARFQSEAIVAVE